MVAWNEDLGGLPLPIPRERAEWRATPVIQSLCPKVAHVIELLMDLSALQAKLANQDSDAIVSWPSERAYQCP